MLALFRAFGNSIDVRYTPTGAKADIPGLPLNANRVICAAAKWGRFKGEP